METPTTTPAQKPGLKSTEFWLSMPGAIALIELARGLEDVWSQRLAIAGAVAIVLWYTYKRAELKRAAGAA